MDGGVWVVIGKGGGTFVEGCEVHVAEEVVEESDVPVAHP